VNCQTDEMKNSEMKKWCVKNGDITKWWVEEMVNWQSGESTKWWVEKWQVDWIDNWKNDKLTKWWVDKMANWKNCELKKKDYLKEMAC